MIFQVDMALFFFSLLLLPKYYLLLWIFLKSHFPSCSFGPFLKPYLQMGNKRWNSLEAPDSVLFPWDVKSTYIRCPSFFDKLVSTSVLFDLLKMATILKKGVGRESSVFSILSF